MATYPIIVAGMGHSGSTMLYNMIMKICEYDNTGKNFSFHKFHKGNIPYQNLNKNPNLKVITHIRDMRDAVASHIRKSNKNKSIAFGKSIEWILMRHTDAYEDWKDFSDYEFKYERYAKGSDQERVQLIIEVSNVIEASVTKDQATRILHFLENKLKKNIDIGNNSKMSQYHVTNDGKIGGYKKTLSSNQINYIEKKCYNWMVEKGYLNEQ